MFDLIGIGALNLDCVASKTRVLSLQPSIADALSHKFEHKTERPVSEEEIKLTLSQMGISTFETFLGGSAFNTIHTIAAVNPGLRLGYVGVAGNTGVSGLDFVDAMKHFGIDTKYVKTVPGQKSGVCISYMAADERSLLTYPGVNKEMSEHLKENHENIITYLSQAKIIHVTSLFDDKSPDLLLQLLRDVKRLNPWVKISFDPGYHWIKYITPAISGVLKSADFLFLNNKEFEILGHYRPGSQDIDVARTIIDLCQSDELIIILKQYDSIKLFYQIQGRMMVLSYSNVVLPSKDIEDAAGAGDIFAGGFLTAMLVPGMEIRHGVDLGLRLVRSKLLVAGSKSFHTFPAIFSELINEITSSRIDLNSAKSRVTPKPPIEIASRVFVGHGRNPIWSRVVTFLQDECGVSCKTFESDTHIGEHVVSVLTTLSEASDFAVMILTAEDETADGTKRARQNVLHEIGLFQGRLGFTKVALLVQKGVEGFSNILGVQYIQFHENEISQTFYELRRVLQREGVI